MKKLNKMAPRKLQRNKIEKMLGLSTGWGRFTGLILMSMAIVSGLTGLWLFPQSGQVNLAWFLYLCSVVFFIVALFLLFGKRGKVVKPLFVNWKYVLSLSIILGLAIFMRLYLFSSIPFGTWFDEGDIGHKALQIVDGTGELPVFYSLHSQPLHFTYLVSLSFRLFGVSTLSIRIITVAFGLLAVGAAYILGNEILGPRFGLILAFFFAVGRWHVTFSRLGLATITTPFFVLITFYFLFRAIRTKKPLYFGLCGVALGLGLNFHTAFRVVPIAMILFFIYWAIRYWRDGTVSSSPRILWIINIAVFLLGTGLTIAPVAQYALREPESFWKRTSEVSIFDNRDEPDLGQAVVSNTFEHLLMFNYQGDRNGRHNLPGEPMLDPISGVLFVLGLGLALRRMKQPIEFSFLIIFIVGLSAGILTVDFESPQAQRSIAALPAVYFFTSLAVDSIWRVIQRSGFSQIHQLFFTASLFVAGVYIVYLNAHTYFVRQANDLSVWSAHNPIETTVGNELHDLEADQTTVYLSMFLQNNSIIQFLAPDFKETKTILPPDVVPLREPGDKSVILFIDQDQAWVVDAIRDLYPEVKHTVFFDLIENPILHKVVVSPEEIQAIQGLMGRYWKGDKFEGESEIFRTDNTLEVYWPADSPIAPPFVAEWEGILYIPKFDQYQLLLEAPGEATIWMDELQVLQKDATAEGEISVQLSQGNHTLKVRATGGEGPVRLTWRSSSEGGFEAIPSSALYLSPPVFSNGLVGSYYERGDWDSDPSFVRIDPFVDMYFHLLPLQRPYGVEWEGEIEIPTTGEYEFGLRVNGEAQLYINEELVVDASQPTEYMGGKIQLGEGRNTLRLRFLDHLSASRIHLYWTKPGGVQSVIPSFVLFPKP